MNPRQNATEASQPRPVAGLQDKSVSKNWILYTALDMYASLPCR